MKRRKALTRKQILDAMPALITALAALAAAIAQILQAYNAG